MKRFIFGVILISIFSATLYFSISFLNTPVYKIRFNPNGGSKVENILIKENTSLKSLPLPTKENYEFAGWYLDNEPFKLETKITKDYLLEAIWLLKDLPTYKISFDTLNGDTLEPLIKEEGTINNTDLPIPTKEGYTFKYWLYQNKQVTTLLLTHDITLIAFYEKN